MAVVNHEEMTQAGVIERRYDLTKQEAGRLISDTLVEQGLSGEKFMCLSFGADHPMSNVARTVEKDVFEPVFGNDLSVMKSEYDAYETGSRFLMVIDTETKQAAGVLRILQDSPAGLKSLDDMWQFGVTAEQLKRNNNVQNLSEWWDIGTIAVAPEYRGNFSGYQVSTLLYRSLFVSAKREGIKNMVTLIDKKARAGLQFLGIPFKDIPGTHPAGYLGSKETYPMYGDVTTFEAQVQERYRSAIEAGSNQRVAAILGRLAAGNLSEDIVHDLSSGQEVTADTKAEPALEQDRPVQFTEHLRRAFRYLSGVLLTTTGA